MSWIEATPTINNGGHLYGEHDGAPNTEHKFRWVYSDKTPVVGELGEWITCTHCEPVREETCEDCEMEEGRHTFSCQTNWVHVDELDLEGIVDLIVEASEDLSLGLIEDVGTFLAEVDVYVTLGEKQGLKRVDIYRRVAEVLTAKSKETK